MLQLASTLAVDGEFDDCFIYENCQFMVLFYAQYCQDDPYEEESQNNPKYWHIMATQVSSRLIILFAT